MILRWMLSMQCPHCRKLTDVMHYMAPDVVKECERCGEEINLTEVTSVVTDRLRRLSVANQGEGKD